MQLIVAATLTAVMLSLSGVATLTTDQRQRAELQQVRDQLLAARIDGARCRAQQADVTAQLDGVRLTAEQIALKASRAALESELLLALGAKPGDVVDWTTTPPTLKAGQ
jgi:hypothetical protein